MIGQSDKYFQDQIDATKQWGETQKQNQQAQTDFAIEKIEQQKQQTVEDYQTEQAASYADWQKQSNNSLIPKLLSALPKNTGAIFPAKYSLTSKSE